MPVVLPYTLLSIQFCNRIYKKAVLKLSTNFFFHRLYLMQQSSENSAYSDSALHDSFFVPLNMVKRFLSPDLE